MGPERSNPLHNFSFPHLKWGTQRLLRCVNDPNNNNNSSKFNPPQNDTKPKNNDSINVVQQTIINDLKLASNDLKVSIFNDDAAIASASASVVVASNGGAIRPWNLRTRRAACKAPPPPPPPIPPREEGRRFFDVGSSSPSPKKKMKMIGNEKVKFSVSLSKEEVEQDFWALLGTRPPRRPRKRPRIVQRQLDVSY